MNAQYGILMAGATIAAAILFRPQPAMPRYEMVPFGTGVVARIDTKTGGIELCGIVQNVIQFMPMDLVDDMRKTHMPDDQIQSYIERANQAAIHDRCFEINDGRDSNRRTPE